MNPLITKERYAWNCQNIQEIQVEVGRWLDEVAELDDVIATYDAGAVRYWSNREVLDMVGLNDHEVAAGGVQRRVAELEPRFFLIFPPSFAQFAGNPLYQPVRRLESSRYTICECPQDVMLVLRRRDLVPKSAQ